MKNNFIYFLFSPFIGFIQALNHNKKDWAKNSVWLFVIFYGFTMCHPEIMDSSRTIARLQELYNTPLSWDVFIVNFYNADTGIIDVYEPLVTYFLSLFTESGNILFAVFGIVYGYFYSRNIWLLLDLAKEVKRNKLFWLLLISFSCVIGFWNLNGVRMWTAAQVFFYGGFLYLVHGNKKGLLIAISSVLIHFSFVLPVGVLLIYTFIKIPWRFLYFVFIASFFISSLNVEAVRNLLESNLPEVLLPRVQSYTSDEYVEVINELNSRGNWYVGFYGQSLSWYLVALFTIIYFSKLKNSAYDKSFSNLFGFSLLFLSVGNITSLLPSGGRYLIIAQLFGMAVLFFYFVVYPDKRYIKWATLFSPLLVFFIIVSIRTSFDTITLLTVFGNPILAVIFDTPIPLIDLIK